MAEPAVMEAAGEMAEPEVLAVPAHQKILTRSVEEETGVPEAPEEKAVMAAAAQAAHLLQYLSTDCFQELL
jgi:hypothetical protein